MRIAREKPLVGDLRERLAPFRDGAILLGLDQLVNSAFPRAVGNDAPGIFVDDLHLAVGDNVLHVALVEVEDGQRMLYEFLARATNGPQTRQPAGDPADLVLAGGGQSYHLLICTHVEVVSRRQTPGDIECGFIETGGVFGALLGSGEDKRHTRLVDQHTVGLVDDRKMQPSQEERLMAGDKPTLEYLVDEEPCAGAA